jgi:hypothetical protein
LADAALDSRTDPDPILGPRPRSVVVFCLAAALSTVVLAATYVRAERTVHFWDFAVFHEVALRLRDGFAVSLGAGLDLVRASLSDDYNALFAIELPGPARFRLFARASSAHDRSCTVELDSLSLAR